MSNFKKKLTDTINGDRFSSATLTALIIAVLIVVNVILYTLVEIFGWYWYLEEKRDLSLTGNSDVLFAEAIETEQKVTITFFQTESALRSSQTGAQVYITANQLKQKYPDLISVRYINVITKIDQDGKIVDLSKYTESMDGTKNTIDARAVLFECETNGNYRVVSDTYSSAGFASFFTFDAEGYETSYNGEEMMSAMIRWVLDDEQNHKKAYFTKNHGEKADIAFSDILVRAGYTIDLIDLRSVSKVPEDCDLLVISNPTSDFEAAREGPRVRTEIERIKTYIEEGGNLYVSLDPVVKALPIFEKFLSDYGISYSTSVDKESKTYRNYVKDNDNAVSLDGLTLISEYAQSDMAKAISKTVSEYESGRVIIERAVALNLDEEKNAKPLLISSSSSELVANGEVVERGAGYCVAAYSEVVTGDKTARIFVVPSIYLTSSGALVSGYSNRTFMFALFEELYGIDGLPYGCNNVIYDTGMLENLSKSMKNMYTIIIMAIPAAIAVTGAIITTRRKNR